MSGSGPCSSPCAPGWTSVPRWSWEDRWPWWSRCPAHQHSSFSHKRRLDHHTYMDLKVARCSARTCLASECAAVRTVGGPSVLRRVRPGSGAIMQIVLVCWTPFAEPRLHVAGAERGVWSGRDSRGAQSSRSSNMTNMLPTGANFQDSSFKPRTAQCGQAIEALRGEDRRIGSIKAAPRRPERSARHDE